MTFCSFTGSEYELPRGAFALCGYQLQRVLGIWELGIGCNAIPLFSLPPRSFGYLQDCIFVNRLRFSMPRSIFRLGRISTFVFCFLLSGQQLMCVFSNLT